MKKSAIDEVLQMVTALLDGTMSVIDFQLDFPYEVTKNYKKMCREDLDMTDLIYIQLIENGTDIGHAMSDKDFLALIKKQYKDVSQGVW